MRVQHIWSLAHTREPPPHYGSSERLAFMPEPLDPAIGAGHSTEDLRRAHTLLRAELSNIGHWRRLLRARMDLCTAHVAPPLPLAGQITEYFSASDLEATHDIYAFPQTVLGELDGLHASSLPHLKTLDTTLRNYERNVRKQYMVLSDQLAQRHA